MVYGKCSKILNTFLVLFSNKMLVITAGIQNMLVRIANRKDIGQTASSLICVWDVSPRSFWQLLFQILECLSYSFLQ